MRTETFQNMFKLLRSRLWFAKSGQTANPAAILIKAEIVLKCLLSLQIFAFWSYILTLLLFYCELQSASRLTQAFPVYTNCVPDDDFLSVYFIFFFNFYIKRQPLLSEIHLQAFQKSTAYSTYYLFQFTVIEDESLSLYCNHVVILIRFHELFCGQFQGHHSSILFMPEKYPTISTFFPQ